MLNNRELAALIWSGVAGLWMLSRHELRRPLAALGRSVMRLLILGPILAMAAYTAGLAAAGGDAGLWSPSLIKETTIWFLGIGLGLLLSLDRVSDQDGFFRRSALRAARITIFVEFYVNLAVLPLIAELVLAPLLVLLCLMSAVADGRPDLRPAKALVDRLVAAVGIGLAGYVALRLFTDWGTFDRPETWQALVLPIWLTIGVLPFVYGVGLLSRYQLAWNWINMASEDPRARRRTKLALLTGMHVRVRDLAEFNLFRANEAVDAGSYRAARAVVARVRLGRQEERRAEADRSDRLQRFAGADGTDEQGLRLDQREFDETKEALQWIATAQVGWHSNPPGRYRDDLITMLEPFPGLPPDHGITMRVTSDGQAWWAARRTVTGWWFAIGAAGPPPDEWLYDGPKPPSGFPGRDPAWGERWGIGATNWGLGIDDGLDASQAA